ncbi:ABC transporter ATP-binding protein [Nocardia rhamnosiphila]|uniref:ATP-binding cassette domain-containing protein n=1 Tax=Nocardia rhamnosiphila TaxID=426716 RepID=A0ABV2WYQ9_9NOCA
MAFGGVAALQDLTFEVDQGETVAVIGPNGAGKTTLLNALCGLVSATSDTLQMGGRDLTGMQARARAQLGLARSYQNPPLLEKASVLENLMCGGHLQLGYGMLDELFRPWRVRALEREFRARCEETLEFIGIAEHRLEEVSGMPHGLRKLVDIGRAIVSRPSLLLLDEPSSGLDSGEQQIVVRVINGLQETGDMSLLVVEHHMEVVREVADRVIGMQAGTVLKLGTPTEVLDSEEFREALIGAHRTDGESEGEVANG